MAIFSILHLWAFTFYPYVSGQQGDEVTDLYGNGAAKYYGGPLGVKAIADALNPLDLIKAVSRGLRWLFVGRKHRTLDPSYRDDTEAIGLNPAAGSALKNTAYEGAGRMMPGAGAGGRSGRYGPSPDEEGAVLLGHAQPNPTTSSGYEHEHSSGDLGIAPSPDEMEHGEDQDRFYSSTSNRLSTSSLLEPAPRPYSPSDGRSHSPYFPTPSDSDDPHHIPGRDGRAAGYPYHSRDGSLQDQPPIPMPEPHRPPPLHDDYDDYERR